MTSMFSVGGLSSGLDTDSIITKLLQIERIPITQIESKQTALRGVDSTWSGIVTKLSSVRTALDQLKSATDYGSHTSVTSSSDAVAVSRSGSPAPGGLSFTVTKLASAYQGSLSGSTTLGSATDLVGAGTLRIQHADGTAFTDIDTTGKTLAQVATAIQSNADVQVNASVQQASDGSFRLVLSSRRSGADGGLVFDLTGAPSSLNSETELFAAEDAVLTMGSGVGALQITSATNRITNLVPGLTVDLKQATTSPVTVQVERDTAVTVEKVRELVDALNATISALKTNTGYNAETGTAGKLQGENTARSMRFDLTGALAVAVKGLTGKFQSAISVGIEVERDGTLTFDKDVLSAALAEDSDGVISLFTAPAKPEVGEPGPGLFSNLSTMMKEYEGAAGRIATARAGLTNRIDAYDDQIERYEVRIELRERLLRKKWSGLESALSVIQAQGTSLLSTLGASSS
jgi:flagellar hook-associated protein 2